MSSRKLIVSMFLTLDGFVVGPREELDSVMNSFAAEEMGSDMGKLQSSAGAFL